MATSESFVFWGVIIGDTNGFILKKDAVTLEEYSKHQDIRDYLKAVNNQSSKFLIEKYKSENCWGRTQSYIGLYSSMKLEIVTNYVIQTYNPAQYGLDFGYYVTRTPLDSADEFNVRCIYGNIFTESDATLNTKLLSYYIITGIIRPEFIKR